MYRFKKPRIWRRLVSISEKVFTGKHITLGGGGGGKKVEAEGVLIEKVVMGKKKELNSVIRLYRGR